MNEYHRRLGVVLECEMGMEVIYHDAPHIHTYIDVCLPSKMLGGQYGELLRDSSTKSSRFAPGTAQKLEFSSVNC